MSIEISQSPLRERMLRMTVNSFEFPANNYMIDVPQKYYFLFSENPIDGKTTFSEILSVGDKILQREEERNTKRLDNYGRFPRSCSQLVKYGYDQIPVIDELLRDIASQINLEIKPIWPDGKKAAVCLTHDVDQFDGRSFIIFRKLWWHFLALKSLVEGHFEISKKYMGKIRRWADSNYDPVYAFNKWMALEDKYGLRSTFFFFGLKHALSREGRLYSYRNERVRETIRRLDENGWEIGLHAGYYRNLELESLICQKKNLEDALGKKVLGCRHHYLRVRFPESWELYQNAGFEYSSNMGWGGGSQGFRAGTSLPYRPLSKRALVEIPFQLMDLACIENPVEYYELFIDYINKVKKVNGCLVIDFHQQYFDEIESPGTNRAYRMILKKLSEDDEIWVAPLNDIHSHICSKYQEI